ncbi:PfkB family carbohydrate kinase [Microlunatus ginsengisoli]|uniref:Carbohydrate kinase n=1 Tax=Microlunatus ginsengisoli TaxID=363863 RepID=A0ABP7AT15_9ACTN
MSTSSISASRPAAHLLSLGEALIDVVIGLGSAEEHVGGSLLNVAVGAATLGRPTSIASWWGKDERGDRLAAWADSAGVEIVPGTNWADRTSVAFADLDEHGRARYEFDLDWQVPVIEDLSRHGHVHTGSIAATLEPGGSQVVELVTRAKTHATISYDPNIRPSVMSSPAAVRDRIENLVGLSDLVKASDEDLGWLYPDEPVEEVMRRWVRSGPAMVVVTRGPWGAHAALASDRDMLHVDQLTVPVVDTVGAGDSFMAGLVSGLLDSGLLGSLEAGRRLREAGWAAVQPALHRAVVTSALTVSHAGAYAPTIAEVEAVRQADPRLR